MRFRKARYTKMLKLAVHTTEYYFFYYRFCSFVRHITDKALSHLVQCPNTTVLTTTPCP